MADAIRGEATPELSSGNYTVYHLHSDYSLLDSCTKFEDYLELAKQAGMGAIASTEHGKPLGWVSKKIMCEEAGIKFIHGVEIYLTEQLEPKVRDNYHTVLLAKNFQGVLELNELASRSCDSTHFYYNNRISFDEFLQISPNIIKISACLASPLNKLPFDHPRYMELAKGYDYLEIQPHLCAEQVSFNTWLYNLSLMIDKPLIAGTDTHNASTYKAECRKLLMKRKRKSYGNEDAFDLTWKTYDELVSMFRQQDAMPQEAYLQAIENTNVMADSVEDFVLDRSIKYPVLYGSPETDSQKFDELISQKLQYKLENGIIPPEQEQAFRNAIQEEVEVFRTLGMTGFMLSMSEILTWCREQGFALGPARGSVGGSRIAYILDIIDLNPETWHTVFSRFANSNRLEIGDIDIDCVDSDRPAIFHYIVSRFGREHTARVGSYGTIADLGVIDDTGGALRIIWDEKHPNRSSENPWDLQTVSKIKKEYSADPEKARAKYSELFYYFDGLLGTRVSQSVHPAGMVISPLNLMQAYGVFEKDDDLCLFINMDDLHEVGAAKYDFLVLKNVQVLRDAAATANVSYPRSDQIDWNDQAVWKDMLRSPVGIFQMEGKFAFDSLKKFNTSSIFDMSLVTAAIRPSGASYRDSLLARKPNRNPSPIIDELLKDNNGYLVYQCDVIKFLQQICGLSGSEADNIRRAIGRKDHDRLQKALPSILDGYCSKSDKPPDEAREEAMEFLRIIEDASSYMFGYNHSIAYCLIGYLCAYFRYYHTIDFITSFLNNAANDEDIANGTHLAKLYGIKVTTPKFDISRSEYFFNREENTIAKGVSSIAYIGAGVADELYAISQSRKFDNFTDVLSALFSETRIDSRQLDILIKIDFFSAFGNQRELLLIADMFEKFKRGTAKEVRIEEVASTPIEPIIRKYATWHTKSGKEAKSYKLLDVMRIIAECEELIKSQNLPDLDIEMKVRNFDEAMGYVGYVSGKDEDRPKLYVKDIFPVKRKKDGAQFGYSILTYSIGSGKESRFTVFNRVYEQDPIHKKDIIVCKKYLREGQYFTLTNYEHFMI